MVRVSNSAASGCFAISFFVCHADQSTRTCKMKASAKYHVLRRLMYTYVYIPYFAIHLRFRACPKNESRATVNEMAKGSTVAKCFTTTRHALARDGVALDGGCLEASAELLCCLRAKGENARLIRRELPRGQGGHWTVETVNGEVDPTIGFWRTGRPRGVAKNKLYAITAASPHRRWRRTPVDEKRALQIGLGRNPPASCKMG